MPSLHYAHLTAAALAGLAVAPLSSPARADDAGAPPESRGHVEPAPEETPGGLSFLGLLQLKATANDLTTTNPFLDGQVIGVLGGTNGTEVADEGRALFTEQRAVGFFTYAPRVIDARASLTAAFEVDMLWGDQSYGAGGNTGGAYGADQVNLQTRRLHGTFEVLDADRHALEIVAGLQFLSDGARNPAAVAPDDLFRAGGGLIFFGSEAAGLSAFGAASDGFGERLRYRLGGYTLYEHSTVAADDVAIWMADAQLRAAWATWIGLHLWYLQDRSEGDAGLLGVGPSSALAQLQGTPYLDLRTDGETVQPPVDADLFWGGLDLGWNHDLKAGPVGATALAVVQGGTLYVGGDADNIPVLAGLLDAEVRLRYAAGSGSVARLEALYATPDVNRDDRFTGLITGNSYGIAGALWATHGCLMLFSDPRSINRQVAVVYDPSNAGSGLVALTGGVGYDLVPERLTAAVGGGYAVESAGSDPVGTELNARLTAHPWLLADLGVAGAVVTGTEWDRPPWQVYAFFDWIVF